MQISALVIEVSTEWEKRSSKDEFISVNLFLFVSYSIQEEVYIYIYVYISSNLFEQIYQFLLFVISFQRIESKIESYKYST